MERKGNILWLIWGFVLAALFLALGIVMCAFSGDNDFRKVVILLAGIFILADSAFRLLTQVVHFVKIGNKVFVKADVGSAVAVAAETAIGVLLCIMYGENNIALEALFRYAGFFLGIFLIAVAVISAAYTILFVARKFPSKLLIGSACGLFVVAAVIGIVIVYFAAQDASALLGSLFIFLGIVSIIIGVGTAIVAGLLLYLNIAQRREAARSGDGTQDPIAAQTAEGAIDVEVTDVKPEEPRPEDGQKPDETK